MPSKLKTRKPVIKQELKTFELDFLIKGEEPIFDDDILENIEQKWVRHKDYLMQLNPQPGKRPYGWWIFTIKAPEERIRFNYVG